MTTRHWLLIVAVTGCGPKPAPTAPTAVAALVGTWADVGYTATLRADHDVAFATRLPCARLPCASGTGQSGAWSTDGATLTLGGADHGQTYRLHLDEGGAVLVLAPESGAALRLRRQPALALAGTAWDAPERTLSFTADGFERSAPCADCEDPIARVAGTWTFEDGELAIEYDGANESFGVLIEAGGDELVLIGPTETVRYHRRPR